MESAELPMIILGWCMLLYGFTETINSIMVYSLRRRIKRQQEEAAKGLEAEEIATEVKEELPQQPVEEVIEEVSQSDIIVEEE